MIRYYTGTMGSGKTCAVLADVLKFKKEFPDGDVYYFHIEELDPSLGWIELSGEEVTRWTDLPPGSCLVLDEVHKLIPSRRAAVACPQWVIDFDEHRRRGIEIWCVTQHPTKCDVMLRRYVGYHCHFERKYGFNWIIKWEWSKCVDDPDDRHKRGEGARSRAALNKHVWGLYKSAEVHRQKRHLPKKIIAGGVVLVIAPLLAIYLFMSVFTSAFLGDDDGEETEQERSGTEGDRGEETAPASSGPFRSAESEIHQWWMGESPPVVAQALEFWDIQSSTAVRPSEWILDIDGERVSTWALFASGLEWTPYGRCGGLLVDRHNDIVGIVGCGGRQDLQFTDLGGGARPQAHAGGAP